MSLVQAAPTTTLPLLRRHIPAIRTGGVSVGHPALREHLPDPLQDQTHSHNLGKTQSVLFCLPNAGWRNLK
ncbi:hypothetical protein N9444_08895 [Gammaproteobacteria bacterium]|nr:hypothetical protein [Gammaproteobacteria bacterium]